MAAGSRTPTLRYLYVWTVIAGLATLVTLFELWADLNGADTTATVVHVYSPTAYTVTFTTRDGTHCLTPHKWPTRPGPIDVGDPIDRMLGA